MLDSIVKAATELKEKVATKSEVVKILNEATNNDNWNISNSKLQVLADHTYDWNDYNVIMKHLWSKLTLKQKEWRKIFKALHALDYLLKNGAPRIVQEIRDDLYKIRSLQDMEYVIQGKDK
jgi:epsin